MAATIQDDQNTDPIGDTPFDLGAAASPKGRSRAPEILVGTLLVAVFALGGAWFYSTSTQSVGYLALRQDVVRGQIVERDDLTAYGINTDAPILGMRANEANLIVGQVALADLKIGTLITPDQFAQRAQIPAGAGIVGLDLEPGEFPTLSLRPGDRVRVVLLPDSRAGGAGGTQGEVIIDSVEVVEVADFGDNGRFISLTMPAEVADRVAIADAQERIRLIQVAGS